MADSGLDWHLDRYRQSQLPHTDHLEYRHNRMVFDVCLQGNFLVSASVDRTVRVWNLETQRLLYPALTGHAGSVRAVQFDAAADEDVIISGGNEGDVIVWRFSTGEAIQTVTEAHDEGACVGGLCSLHFDKIYLATGGRQGEIKLFNRRSLNAHDTDLPSFVNRRAESEKYPAYSLLATFTGHENAVLALQLRGDVLVSGSGDSTMCIWSLQTGEILRRINIHQSGVACLQYNGRYIVSGSTSNAVKIYDVDQDEEIACLEGHSNVVRSVRAIFDDNAEVMTVVSSSYDGSIKVWKPETGSHMWRKVDEAHISGFGTIHSANEECDFSNRINSIALDDSRLVCAGHGPVIRVWDFHSLCE